MIGQVKGRRGRRWRERRRRKWEREDAEEEKEEEKWSRCTWPGETTNSKGSHRVGRHKAGDNVIEE